MATRIPSVLLGKERPYILKMLKVEGKQKYQDTQRNKRYGTPLPDLSVECFRDNPVEEYLDVPFWFGRRYYVEKKLFLENDGHVNLQMKKRKFTSTFTGTLRPKQVPFVEEAENMLNENHCVLLSAHPGFGKTVSSVHLAVTLGSFTLIVVNRRPLLEQWKDTILKRTDASIWVYGESVPSESVQFIVTMIGGLKNFPEEYLKNVGTLILDEAHMLATPTQVPDILRIHPHHLILCTATPDRDARTTSILKGLVGAHRVVRRYDGFLKVVQFNTGISKDCKTTKSGIVFSDYVKQLSEDEERNEYALSWILCNPKRKILVLTPGKDHSVYLSEYFSSHKVSCDYYSGNRKAYQESQVLVGTFSKIGVGFDPAAKKEWDGFHYDMLLMMGTTKSLSLIEQLWGRVFRAEKPYVIVFHDSMHISANHFREMKKIAKMYQADVINTERFFTIGEPVKS